MREQYNWTSRLFQSAHRGSGRCGAVQGMVDTSIGSWSEVPCTEEKSMTRAEDTSYEFWYNRVAYARSM